MSHYTNNIFIPESENNSWAHLFQYVPKGSSVLDIGCSSGNFGQTLINEKKCTVVGLDIDADDVKKAKTRLSAAYVRNIESDTLDDLGTFDVVILADVIEHLIDPISSLKRVKRLLNKDGQILFSIPNMAHVSIRLMLLKGFFEYTDTGLLDRTHLHYYDEPGVEEVFARAGLSITHRRPTTVTYPKSVLDTYLLGMGLQANKDFYDQLETTKGQIFEFVGTAVPTTNTAIISRSLKYTFPTDELSQEIVNRDKIIQEQQAAIGVLSTTLENITNSRSWKLTKPLRKVNKRSTKPKNGNTP